MTNEELKQHAKSLDKEQFLKFVYLVLALNPQWVTDVVKSINAAIKDEWIEKED